MSNKNFLDHINGKNDDTRAAFEKETFTQVKRSYKMPIIISVTVLLGISLIMFFSQKEVTVPDLTGMDLTAVIEWAETSEVKITEEKAYSPQPVDVVIEQLTPVGEDIKPNDVIKVVVSEGLDPYENISLPSFDSSWSKSTIVNWLTQNGVENYKFIEQVSDTIEESYLIDYKLIGADETNFNRSSTVEFTISQVISKGSVEVPDFLNDTLTEVDIWATKEGISYEYVYEYNSLYDADKIFSQSVLPGQNMSDADTLIVKVAGSDANLIEMDNFIDSSLNAAETWLKTNQVKYNISYVYSNSYSKNTVIDQNFYEGDLISNETIVLTVSLGEGVQVKDFSTFNKYEAEIEMDSHYEIMEIYSDVPKGDFIKQSDSSGSYINDDETVILYYSLGDYIQVPDFREELVFDVETWVAEQNLIGASISYVVDEVVDYKIESGKIIRQDVLNGKMPLDGVIHLDVSMGYRVPNFSLMSVQEANLFGDSSSMDLNVVEVYHATVKEGNFIKQSEKPNAVADKNSSVTVEYSLGSEVHIPSFKGQPLGNLESHIDTENDLLAKLSVQIVEQFDDSVPYGEIIAQSVANKSTEVGSTIKVIVSRGESYTVPNLKSLTEEYAVQKAEDYGIGIIIEYIKVEGQQSGTVYSQSPAPYDKMSFDEFLTIQVVK